MSGMPTSSGNRWTGSSGRIRRTDTDRPAPNSPDPGALGPQRLQPSHHGLEHGPRQEQQAERHLGGAVAEDQWRDHQASTSGWLRRAAAARYRSPARGMSSPASSGRPSVLPAGASGHAQAGSYAQDGLYAKLKSRISRPSALPRSAPLAVSMR